MRQMGRGIPQDLNLNWAISKKKNDLAERELMREYLCETLIGGNLLVETLDGSVLPDGSYAVGTGRNEMGRNIL